VVFCRGFIYETRFAKGSDKSDLYNMGVFHQPPRACKAILSASFSQSSFVDKVLGEDSRTL